ncbi:hypothetical protein Pmani_036640 [Petrolisthes manimaculis]|uniref:Uncharacterized protein n=1 Tax=Petrolisthes manimaculis TaxID=1843537 RepID=A0AAE1TM78_9EUCA|nr:hypothetical protein Pmani_036640 [Petrolisthes manimaculis]
MVGRRVEAEVTFPVSNILVTPDQGTLTKQGRGKIPLKLDGTLNISPPSRAAHNINTLPPPGLPPPLPLLFTRPILSPPSIRESA